MQGRAGEGGVVQDGGKGGSSEIQGDIGQL
jgi:hypothetical protein